MTSAEQKEPAPAKYLSVRQAAFIGVGSMVGAGIFALLGAAGAEAGAAVWLSFLLAGIVAVLQGYSFAKFGAKYPSAGGLLEYVSKGFGDGHFTGITAWLTYAANAIVTAMVAVSFGSYATEMFTGDSKVWAKVFAALIIIAMTAVNVMMPKPRKAKNVSATLETMSRNGGYPDGASRCGVMLASVTTANRVRIPRTT